MESKSIQKISGNRPVEELLAAIVESSDDAIVGKDLNGVIVSWNSSAERIFGYTAAEAIGKSISLIIPEERIADMRHILDSVSRGVRVEHHETRRRRKDGVIIDVSLTVSPIRDESGKIIGASKIARDITEAKRAQHEIERQSLRLQTLYEATRTLSSSLDPSAIYVELCALVARVMDCDALVVSSYSSEDNMVRRRFAMIEGEVTDVDLMPALLLDREGGGPKSQVIRTGKPLLVSDGPDSPATPEANGRMDSFDWLGHPLISNRPPVRSMMLVPILLETEVMGVVQVMSHQPNAYDAEDLELFEGLVLQMAAASKNAELYQRTLQNAAAFELLANAMPQIAWALDANGKMDFLNGMYTEYTGQDASLLPDDAWSQIVHPDDRAVASKHYWECVAGGRIWEQELRLRSKSGEFRWHLSRLAPVRDADGKIVRWFGTSTDIHDRKMAEALAKQEGEALRSSREELRRLNEDLERRVEERTAELRSANEEMEGFTYSVSHDLRAPLRAIMASSMMLLEDFGTELPEEAKRHLHRQAAAAKKLAMLIDDLLQYSRLGRKAVDRQSVAISSVAQAIADELSRRHPERLVDWKIQPGLEVQGDPNLATMLLQNLFDNAFKFTSGREHAAIEFGKDDLGFFVRDNGVGFDMQYSGKLFRPFERLHPEVDYEGTGIGLANVKRIVERHGGRVSAEGKVGEGATFRFAF